jgi:hypothetical protein
LAVEQAAVKVMRQPLPREDQVVVVVVVMVYCPELEAQADKVQPGAMAVLPEPMDRVVVGVEQQ